MIRLGIAPRVIDITRGALQTVDSWFNQVTERFNLVNKAGAMTSAEVPKNQWGFFRNTSTGEVNLIVNDNGTLLTTEIGAGYVTSPVAVGDGGTGATTASGARTNLGLGTIATQAANNVAITGGSISGLTSLNVSGGIAGGSITGTGVLTGRGAINMTSSTIAGNPQILNIADQGGNLIFEMGRQDGVAGSTGFDFHTGATPTGFDVRIIGSGGTGVDGGGTLNLQAANLRWNSVDFGNMAYQSANSVAITGGTISGLSSLTVSGGITATGSISSGPITASGTSTFGTMRIFGDAGTSDAQALIARRATTGGIIVRGYEPTQAFVDLDPMPGDGTSTGTVRFFRTTNTTGAAEAIFYKGDGTSGNNAKISGTSTSYFQSTAGNFLIGKTTDDGTNKLQVAGSIDASNGIIAGGNILSGGLIGYNTGAGGVVTQATSKSTAVTLNAKCGQITMNGAALAAGATVSFTLNNSFISSGDIVICHRKDTGTNGAYNVWVDSAATGSCVIYVKNISGGSLSEAIRLTFGVINGVTS